MLKRIFKKATLGTTNPQQSDPPDSPSILEKVGRRPFDFVDEGIQEWKLQDYSRAETSLRRGVEEYRKAEPGDVHFALGRLGAFYLDRDRVDDAYAVLQEAVKLRSDIPAVWHDFITVMVRRKDIDGLFDAALRSGEALNTQSDDPSKIPWSELLAHARRVGRNGDYEFGAAIANRVVELSTQRQRKSVRWMAFGDLGTLLAKSGDVSGAIDIWKAAFDEGSDDPETSDQLSLHLERQKRYHEATQYIRSALQRQMPPNNADRLRKRLARCEAKSES